VNLFISSPLHVHAQPRGFSLFIVVILVLMAFLHFRGWLFLRRSSPSHSSVWRLVAFLSGLLAIGVAVASPLGLLDHQLLTAHMVKHLLLMVVAAPLTLFGAAGQPLLSVLPNWFARGSSLFTTKPRSLPGGLFRNYIFCWLAGTTTVVVWHIPIFFQLGLSSHAWHTIEAVSFMCAGLLFWKPIITPPPNEAKTPQWSLVLYLFLATVPCDILSAFLVFCDRVVYPYYSSTNQTFSLSALQDQEWAGALMWVTITFAYVIPAVVITTDILSSHGVQFDNVAPSVARRTVAAELRGSEMEVT
jgi:putative membrane protein